MANSFSADFADIWAKEQQRVFYKMNVAKMITDMSFNGTMSKGDVLNRPYRSANAIQKYTRGTAITIDDKTDTLEALTVNAQFATGLYVDDFDKIQSNYDLAANYGKDNGVYLSNQVDADILGEVANAASTVDDATLGGTAGNGITLTTSNVLAVIAAAKKKLAKQNVPMESLFGVISPEFEEVLVQYGAGRDTIGGDVVQDNGFFKSFYGFKLYRSNQTTGSAVLALATNPSDTDSIVIQGVTFTFVTLIGTTAGNVLIAATADLTRANLAALINAPQTTTANGVALSTENQRNFRNLATAVNDNALKKLTVAYKGAGVLTVTKTLTDATDTWTVSKQLQHCMFGVVGAPTLVMQKEPSVEIKEVPDKLGKNVLDGMLYGYKTFADNAKMLVNVKIASSTF